MDLVVWTVLLVVLGLWYLSRLMGPELRRRLPGTNRRLAGWALVVLLFAAIGAPGMPLPAIKVIDVVLWTAAGAVVATVALHHLRTLFSGRQNACEPEPHDETPQDLPWALRAQRPLFWLITGGVSRPSDLLRWSLLIAAGCGCMELSIHVDALAPLSLLATLPIVIGVVLLEISLVVQAWNIWQHRGRRA